MHIFYIGAPGPCGGANSEMGHTLKTWRKHGIDVTVIPTWSIDAATRSSLESIGCTVATVANPDCLGEVPGLAGGIVHSMCNSHFWKCYPKLKGMKCRTVWSSAMTFEFPDALNCCRRLGVCDAHHFQSEFQRAELEKVLLPLGYDQSKGHLIRGAFAFEDMPFNPRPHERNESFIIGRLARQDLDKWSSNHFNILGRVPCAGRRALCMGWSDGLTRKCGGKVPSWAETLPPQAITAREFMGRCHAMVGLNGGARENWPRIGLEAMAAGVPLVCQNHWGWKEMIVDSVTGFLTNNDDEMAYRLAQLAYDEELRQRMIASAKWHVQELACPKRIGEQWVKLFQNLESRS